MSGPLKKELFLRLPLLLQVSEMTLYNGALCRLKTLNKLCNWTVRICIKKIKELICSVPAPCSLYKELQATPSIQLLLHILTAIYGYNNEYTVANPDKDPDPYYDWSQDTIHRHDGGSGP